MHIDVSAPHKQRSTNSNLVQRFRMTRALLITLHYYVKDDLLSSTPSHAIALDTNHSKKWQPLLAIMRAVDRLEFDKHKVC